MTMAYFRRASFCFIETMPNNVHHTDSNEFIALVKNLAMLHGTSAGNTRSAITQTFWVFLDQQVTENTCVLLFSDETIKTSF